ncbi:MAG: hypothetical protein HQK79_15750 [Desulfobacterales bacterium]|nr:hypothetical protein [Desulfobacterales bacterium]
MNANLSIKNIALFFQRGLYFLGIPIKFTLLTLTLLIYVNLEKAFSWENTYGFINGKDTAYSIQETSDVEYVFTGSTTSFGHLNEDIYVVKTDNNGKEIWAKAFGDSNDAARGESIQETSDGGYIVAGTSRKYIGNTPLDYDAVLIKLDRDGNAIWTKKFGNSADDEYGQSVQQTKDGGFIVSGFISLNRRGTTDVYLIKTDINGELMWSKTFHNSYYDYGLHVQETSDDGYIIAGYTRPQIGASDIYLIKTNHSGTLIWSKKYHYGGTTNLAESIQETRDGGYIVAGAVNYGKSDDLFTMKTDKNGNTVWTRIIAYSGYERAFYVEQTLDNGYIVCGQTNSKGNGGDDAYLVKLDEIGNIMWERTFGTASHDYAYSCHQTLDGGYIIGGFTYSSGNIDAYLIKTDQYGISTKLDLNTIPVADAGIDFSFLRLGSAIELDGSKSYDPDGDPILYNWTMISKPEGSNISLINPTTFNPTFFPDIYGEYVFELIVSDSLSTSAPDRITVSLVNKKPVAQIITNQSVVQGSRIILDGSTSYDENSDVLYYSWSIISKPSGSQTLIDSPQEKESNLLLDLPGEYIVQLVVNDGYMNSDPTVVPINVISFEDAAIQNIEKVTDTISNMDPEVFKNENNKDKMLSKLETVLSIINDGSYVEALNKLENDVSKKMDGCDKEGSPDRNDWIESCVEQNEAYPIVKDTVSLLNNLAY